jgi:hypothetical protein
MTYQDFLIAAQLCHELAEDTGAHLYTDIGYMIAWGAYVDAIYH